MRKRTDYRICPHCGAALDVGEKCDCKQGKQSSSGKRATLAYIHKSPIFKGGAAV